MTHIHTSPGQHDHTITMYVIRIDEGTPKALVHLHKKLHKLLPVGGHIELDETPWQAASHEVPEESGYTLDQLQILQPQSGMAHLSDAILHPYPVAVNTHQVVPGHFHTDSAYACLVSDLPATQPGTGESNDLRWYSQHYLQSLDESQIYRNVVEIYNFIFDECIPHWRRQPAIDFQI